VKAKKPYTKMPPMAQAAWDALWERVKDIDSKATRVKQEGQELSEERARGMEAILYSDWHGRPMCIYRDDPPRGDRP